MPTYLSQKMFEAFKKELELRTKILRKEIAEKISVAKELGDLKENSEYHDAKHQQSINESRILELNFMIKDVKIVEEKTGSQEIFLGSTFVVSFEGQKKIFQLVGSSEANPLEGKISNESPIGESFIGCHSGEEITIKTPCGEKKYRILEIK